jgi:hypothetical protein
MSPTRKVCGRLAGAWGRNYWPELERMASHRASQAFPVRSYPAERERPSWGRLGASPPTLPHRSQAGTVDPAAVDRYAFTRLSLNVTNGTANGETGATSVGPETKVLVRRV